MNGSTRTTLTLLCGGIGTLVNIAPVPQQVIISHWRRSPGASDAESMLADARAVLGDLSRASRRVINDAAAMRVRQDA